MSAYEIYKLEEPRLQVGMPNTHKWAVGVHQPYGTEGKSVLMFVEAFKRKTDAEYYIEKKTGDIQLTGREAAVYKNAGGMVGFAMARKIRQRATRLAAEIKKPTRLMFEGEVLYTAQPNT